MHEAHAQYNHFAGDARNIDDRKENIQIVEYGQRKEFKKLDDCYIRNVLAHAPARSHKPKQGNTHKQGKGAEGNELDCVEGCGVARRRVSRTSSTKNKIGARRPRQKLRYSSMQQAVHGGAALGRWIHPQA
eukprot:16439867-Heterocapsa_arctica.AAC.1